MKFLVFTVFNPWLFKSVCLLLRVLRASVVSFFNFVASSAEICVICGYYFSVAQPFWVAARRHSR